MLTAVFATDDHPDTLTTYHKYGNLLRDTGKPHEAQYYYQMSLRGRMKVLGPQHVDTQKTMDTMQKAEGFDLDKAPPRVVPLFSCLKSP